MTAASVPSSAPGSLGVVVPLDLHHLDELYRLETGTDRFDDWRFKGLSPVPNEFATASVGCWMACAVVDSHGSVRGAVTLDRYRPDEATAELAVVAEPGSSGVLVTAGALGVVCGALERGLCAIYLHTTEYQAPVLNMLLKRLRPEVHRIESEWHRARSWDSYVFRIDHHQLHGRLLRSARRAASMAPVDPACFRRLAEPASQERS